MAQRGKTRKKITIDSDAPDIICHRCGDVLDQFTGVVSNTDWDAETMYKHWCRNCQQSYYDAIEDKCGSSLAFFYCCIAFNVPFVYSCVTGIPDESTQKWKLYLDAMRRTGSDVNASERRLSFVDGVTDIQKIFGSKVSDRQFSELINAETESTPKIEGSARQRKEWGTIDHYTTEQYEELDRLYAIQVAPYAQLGAIDLELDYQIRSICKNLLLADSFRRDGKSGDYKKMLDSVEVIRKGINARVSDSSSETVQIDSLIDEMEKAGCATNGKIVSPEELKIWISEDKGHYKENMDIIDEMMFLIVNTMRKNAGMSDMATLPKELQVSDEFSELSTEDTPQDVMNAISQMDLRIPRRDDV